MTKAEKITAYMNSLRNVEILRESLAEAEASLNKSANAILIDDDLAKVLTETGVRTYDDKLLCISGGEILLSDVQNIPCQWELDND